MKFSIKWLLFIPVILLTACSSTIESYGPTNDKISDQENIEEFENRGEIQPEVEGDTVRYEIVAQTASREVKPGLQLPFYTYNGTVPGQEIRAKEGQNLEVQLKNKLDEPVTIHWHGYPVPNGMDGVPGLTQNAVEPGETYTYSFNASIPGTYWYHSHQESAEQVDRGLYGALIIEEKNEVMADKEFTYILDEMNSDGLSSSNGMMGRMMGRMRGNSGYDLFTVNGKTGNGIPDYRVQTGETVRLRFINAGYITHYMHLGSVPYQVIAIDGQRLKEPVKADGQLLPVAPGERYDVQFTVPDSSFFIRDMLDHEAAGQLRIPLVNISSDKMYPEKQYTGILSLTNSQMGTMWEPVAVTSYDREYKMNLSHGMSMGGMVFMVNGKVFPDTDPLNVKKGDRVKVTFKSEDPMFDHPMHLHGHFFQVLSKDGKEIKGDPVMKDTLLVRPGETYEVAFVADNPGNWMFHCHELTHAADGMVTTINYQGVNIPENIDTGQLAE